MSTGMSKESPYRLVYASKTDLLCFTVQTGSQAGVEGAADVTLGGRFPELLPFTPPGHKVRELEAFGRDGVFVDQAVLGVLDDLDVVVHRVPEYDPRLGTG